MIMKTMKQVNLILKRISFLPFLLALCLALCSCGALLEPQDAAADPAEPIAPAETQPAPDIPVTITSRISYLPFLNCFAV